MGNCCGSKEEYTKKHVETLVKIQGAMKVFLAKKKLKHLRNDRMTKIFGGPVLTSSHGEQYSSQVKMSNNQSYSRLNTTAALSQESPFKQQMSGMKPGDNFPQFQLTQNELNALNNDGVQRVFINTTMEVEDSKNYIGQWTKDGRTRDGLGIMIWPDGSKYEGLWKNGKANGRGRMTHANCDIYEGIWRDDKVNGFGIFIDTNSARYEGQWVEDQQHGHGQETWENGAAKYTGDFYKGKKHGKGKFQWDDGSYYEGDFVYGQFEGFGKYFFADIEKVYQGEFRNSNMEGRGIEYWPDGRKYDGEFKNGKKDGEGTFEWPNGNKYIGSWRNGKQHGMGIWMEASEGGMKKQGEWLNGKRARWISGMELISQNSPAKNGQRI